MDDSATVMVRAFSFNRLGSWSPGSWATAKQLQEKEEKVQKKKCHPECRRKSAIQ
jgi:hypothetical protein